MSSVAIEKVSPSVDDIYIFDTNILLMLFYPMMNDRKNAAYENLYAKIICAKSKIIISSLQISEFINQCIRFQFKLYVKSNGIDIEFKKEYRATEDYREKMQAILEIVENDILSVCQMVDDGFSRMKKEQLFIYGFSYDFNDAFISEVARINNAKIVTNDVDYANYLKDNIVISANKGILLFK